MKHLRLILLLIVVLQGLNSMAQNFVLKGVVIEKGSNVRIALAEITNLNNKIGATSNEIGLFEVNAKAGDTLLVKKRNLTDQMVVVKTDDDLVIYLVRGSTMLEEVTVKGQTKKQEMEDIKRDFRHNGSFYAGKPPLILLNPFGGSPLTFFYELFGKTPARARNFNRYYKKELSLIEIDKFFNKSLVISYTTLRGKELDKFLLDYYPSSSMANNWSNYDAVKYIKESAKYYTDTLKRNN
ncbi:carboxypeptidase-like regulatory domain-containing protein [Pedobacter sp. HDW13]|uniref:hypothetical protein n=1 Tax=unclassified Pedobacter TaxID=2628915 RepID=UPI000F594177|nr:MULTISPECIES: hypothetical protein [unclassified Pedobacter]QIL39130.1 carboxypeptidase-like regulatory domain-containing protein [Pedobacter sp. HDW13]RQO63990.1 hypothetical protein DBR40_26620 [Pedobacter sp. KBW01]